jgi:hypothetical protein
MSNNDGWTEDNLIFYHNNEGWAIHPSGKTVCLCQKDSTDKILKGEINVTTVKDDLQRETLIRILEIRKELGYGKREIDTSLRASDIKQRNNQRIRLGITPRNKLQNFKLPKIKQRPSLYSAQPTEQSLFNTESERVVE